jgi:hypothetical protein
MDAHTVVHVNVVSSNLIGIAPRSNENTGEQNPPRVTLEI